jgi:hypothetical protein
VAKTRISTPSNSNYTWLSNELPALRRRLSNDLAGGGGRDSQFKANFGKESDSRNEPTNCSDMVCRSRRSISSRTSMSTWPSRELSPRRTPFAPSCRPAFSLRSSCNSTPQTFLFCSSGGSGSQGRRREYPAELDRPANCTKPKRRLIWKTDNHAVVIGRLAKEQLPWSERKDLSADCVSTGQFASRSDHALPLRRCLSSFVSHRYEPTAKQ